MDLGKNSHLSNLILDFLWLQNHEMFEDCELSDNGEVGVETY